mgnify:CR=1 FL=1
MAEDYELCLYLVDCDGLYEIATTNSDNLKSLYLAKLSSGVIGVPSIVWQEFKELYEEKAAELAPYVAHKINLKKSYHIGAAVIAEKMNSGFSHSPYDRNSDVYVASICSIEDFQLVTRKSRLPIYKEMGFDNVTDLDTWVDS